MSKNKIINNKATTINSDDKPVTSENISHCCDDPILFAMQDNHHQFSMGLFTILECLRLAEKEGHIPKLPENWWVQIENRYNQKYYLL